ncbi:hypothetical protein SAMD00024442_84_6 [Candidatus Symbiothrix dinenymphae]|nr:hypothetical protein SAMD00024442_84_6 [Candidatus Symbiothrix dinenymphae]
MKRIIIICEGETEQEFCKKTLFPHFLARQIYIQSPLIKKSNGGIVKWAELKKQIENHLKKEPAAHVSMLIDYYGLYQKYNFPGWEESLSIVDKNERLAFLDHKMNEDIDSQLRHRFIPYMQLHEFEGLLFNEINIFNQQFTPNEIVDAQLLQATFQQFTNPEMINNSAETAPSKRLAKIIAGYNKVVYGNILAEAIGLHNIINKCPRFNAWITKLSGLHTAATAQPPIHTIPPDTFLYAAT